MNLAYLYAASYWIRDLRDEVIIAKLWLAFASECLSNEVGVKITICVAILGWV